MKEIKNTNAIPYDKFFDYIKSLSTKQIDDIYVSQMLTHFLVSHLDKMQFEDTIKGDIAKLANSLMDKISEGLDNSELKSAICSQQYEQIQEGLVFVEQSVRLMLQVGRKLNPNQQIKFQQAHDNMLRKFKLQIA
jgi:hypothetical protein